MDLAEREEKLRLARKKLSKFQKKRGDHTSSGQHTPMTSGTVTPTFESSVHESVYYSSPSGPLSSPVNAGSPAKVAPDQVSYPFRPASPSRSQGEAEVVATDSIVSPPSAQGRKSMFGTFYTAVSSVAGSVISNGGASSPQDAQSPEERTAGPQRSASPPRAARTTSTSAQSRLVSLLRSSGSQFGNILDGTTQAVRETASAVTGSAFSMYKDINTQGKQQPPSTREKSAERKNGLADPNTLPPAPSLTSGPPPMTGFVPRKQANEGASQQIDLGPPPNFGFIPRANTFVPQSSTRAPSPPRSFTPTVSSSSYSRPLSPGRPQTPLQHGSPYQEQPNYADIDELVFANDSTPSNAEFAANSNFSSWEGKPDNGYSAGAHQHVNGHVSRNHGSTQNAAVNGHNFVPVPGDLFTDYSHDQFGANGQSLAVDSFAPVASVETASAKPPLAPKAQSKARDPSPIPVDLFGGSAHGSDFMFTNRDPSPPRRYSPERRPPSPVVTKNVSPKRFEADSASRDASELFGAFGTNQTLDLFGAPVDVEEVRGRSRPSSPSRVGISASKPQSPARTSPFRNASPPRFSQDLSAQNRDASELFGSVGNDQTLDLLGAPVSFDDSRGRSRPPSPSRITTDPIKPPSPQRSPSSRTVSPPRSPQKVSGDVSELFGSYDQSQTLDLFGAPVIDDKRGRSRPPSPIRITSKPESPSKAYPLRNPSPPRPSKESSNQGNVSELFQSSAYSDFPLGVPVAQPQRPPSPVRSKEIVSKPVSHIDPANHHEAIPFGDALSNGFFDHPFASQSRASRDPSPSNVKSPIRASSPSADVRGRSPGRGYPFESPTTQPQMTPSENRGRATSPKYVPPSPTRSAGFQGIPTSPKRGISVDTGAVLRGRSVSPTRPNAQDSTTASLQQQIADLQNKLAKALKDGWRNGNETSSWSNEKMAFEKQLEESRRVMQENVHERLQFQKKCQDLLAERDGLFAELSQLQSAVADSKAKMLAFGDIERVRSQIEAREEAVDQREQSVKAREDVLEVRTRHLSSTEGEMTSELDGLRHRLESDYATRRDQVERARALVDAEKKAVETRNAEVARKMQTCEEESAKVQKLRVEAEKLTARLSEKEESLKAKASELDKRGREIQVESEKLEDRRWTLEAESRHLNSEKEVLEGRVAASLLHESELKAHRDELDELSRELRASKQAADLQKHKAELEVQRATEMQHQVEVERRRIEEDRSSLFEREAQLRSRTEEFFAGNAAANKETEKMLRLRKECEEDRFRLESDRAALMEREKRLGSANEEILKRSTSLREETERLALKKKELQKEQSRIEEREAAAKKMWEENTAKQKELEASIRTFNDTKAEMEALVKQRETRAGQELAAAERKVTDISEKETEIADIKKALEAERVILKEKEHSLQRLMDEYEKKVSKLPSPTETGKDGLDGLKKKAADLEADREKLAADLKSSNGRVKELVSRLEDSERSNEQFQRNVIKLTELLEAERKRFQSSSPMPSTEISHENAGVPVAVNQKLAVLESRLHNMAAEESRLKETLMSIATSHADLQRFRQEAEPMIEELKVRSATGSAPSSSTSSKPPVYPMTPHGRHNLNVKINPHDETSISDRTKAWGAEEAQVLQESALGEILDASEYEKLVGNKTSFDLLNVIVALTTTNQNLSKKLQEAESGSPSKASSPQISRRAKSPGPPTSGRMSSDNIPASRSREASFAPSVDSGRRRSRSPSPNSRRGSMRDNISHDPDHGSDTSTSTAKHLRRPSSSSSYANTFASDARRRSSVGKSAPMERVPHQGPHRTTVTSTSPVRAGYPLPSQKSRPDRSIGAAPSPTSQRDSYQRHSPAPLRLPGSSRGGQLDQSDIDDYNLESQSEFSEAISPTSNASHSYYQAGHTSRQPRGSMGGRVGGGIGGSPYRPTSREEYDAVNASYSQNLRGGGYAVTDDEGYSGARYDDDLMGNLPSAKDLRGQRRRSSDRPTPASASSAQNRRSLGANAGLSSSTEGLASYFTDEDMAGFSETTRRILFGDTNVRAQPVSSRGLPGDGAAGRRSGGSLARAVSDTEGVGGRFGGGNVRQFGGYPAGKRGSAGPSPAMPRQESLRDVIRSRMKEMDFGRN